MTELTAHRTLALREAVANDPDTAFLAMLHALCLKLFYPLRARQLPRDRAQACRVRRAGDRSRRHRLRQGDRRAAWRLGGPAAEGARRPLGHALCSRRRQPPGAVRALRRRSPSTPCTSPTTAGRRPSPTPTAWPRPSRLDMAAAGWRRPSRAISAASPRPGSSTPCGRRRARTPRSGSRTSRRPRWRRRPRSCSTGPAGCPSRCARRGRASRPPRRERQSRRPASGRRTVTGRRS